MNIFNLTAFFKVNELWVRWYPTERPTHFYSDNPDEVKSAMYQKVLKEWQSSMVEYKVFEESKVELMELLRSIVMGNEKHNNWIERIHSQAENGILIQQLEGRVELIEENIKNISIEDGNEIIEFYNEPVWLFKLKPLRKQEIQDKLWYSLLNNGYLFNMKMTVQELIEKLKEEYTITRK